MTGSGLSRRSVVALAATAPVVAACGAQPGQSTAAPASTAATPTGSPGAALRRTSEAHVAKARPAAGPVLATTAQVPVGGALVVPAEQVVVTQPAAGEFHCFSSVCTHAGCPVRAGATLVCPCHGSQFALADGSVLRGPAAAPLPERRITVRGDEIRLA